MLNKLGLKALIIISIFGAFALLYKLLEKKEIYSSTIGKLTKNYVRVDTNGKSVIKDTNEAFAEFIDKNANNWDVKFYQAIRDSMYAGSDAQIVYRYAFFPLFPLVWKVSHVNIHGIVLMNYLFFGMALILLSSIFLRGSESEIFYFILALLLPISIVYYLPYTESLFILTFSIACIGLLQRKYWLFFIAMVCFTMTRPAALQLLVVFIIANTVNLWGHKRILLYLKDCALTALPILTGWFIVMLIQFHYSASWTTYLEACSMWPKEPDLYKIVRDWSTEGFGMSTFAIFSLAIPAFIYLIVWGSKVLLGVEKENAVSLFSGDNEFIKRYLFKISLLFITGFSLFDLLTSGYQLNGFSRYTMATPFFFIILFQLPGKLRTVPSHYKLAGFILLLTSIWLFLASSVYAGNIYKFQYLGLFLFILLALIILIEPYIHRKARILLLVLFVIPCLLWQTYLFNIFLSNTWIFT